MSLDYADSLDWYRFREWCNTKNAVDAIPPLRYDGAVKEVSAMYCLTLSAFLVATMVFSSLWLPAPTTEAKGEWLTTSATRGIGYHDDKGVPHAIELECQVVQMRYNTGQDALWLIRYTIDGHTVTDRLSPNHLLVAVGPLC
jgi:hypothetical protein